MRFSCLTVAFKACRRPRSFGTFDEGGRTQNVDLGETSWLKNVWSSMKLGIDHIKTGPDHVLFVLVLLLPSVLIFRDKWRPTTGFVSSVAHQPLGTCLRRIGGAMSAAFDSIVSVSNEAMSSTLPALVPGVGEARLAAIAFCKFIRRCGSAINLCRSIARRLSSTIFGPFGAMRPKRRILAITRLWSDSAFSLGGVRTVTLRTNRLSTCRVSM